MENNNFNANGQKVYIEHEWLTGKSCLFNMSNSKDYIKGLIGLSTIRKDFVKRLESEGFVITEDNYNNDENIVYLTMDLTSIPYDEKDSIGAYKRKFDEIIFEAGGPKLNYPKSLSIEEYFKNPFFPAVFKNESTNGGNDKFLIENEQQVEIIKKFYDKYKDIGRYKHQFDCSIFQQLIKTPTEHKTYMRVLMSASGDVLGASLKYSRTNNETRAPRGDFEQHFWDPKSEFYLNCSGMFNYYSGGGNIILGQPRMSYLEKEILKEHGIDPENPTVPTEVLEVASNIVINAPRQLGIMSGIDFIMNQEDGKWYYLEVQAFAAIEEWAIPRKIRIKEVRNVQDYIKYNTLDLEARHEALMLYMNKKNTLQDNNNQPKIKTKEY